MNTIENPHLQYLRSLPTMDQLSHTLDTQYSQADNICFLCYDITLLRKINHAYGRRAGDALLATVAQWIATLTGHQPYRVEGDLFCVLFVGTELSVLYHYAGELETRFGQVWHLALPDRQMDAYAQASIAVLKEYDHHQGIELADVFERALEISRKTRQVTIFDAEYDRLTREHIRLQMELKNCILSGMVGFEVFYQPIADPATCTWRGLEALCRWTGPSIGPVPPNIFIPEAEEMGLIHLLGSWVLNKAMETCKALRLDRLDGFFVSVNVSALQVAKRNYVRTVIEALEKHHYPGHALMLEITESTAFTFNETTTSAIQALRDKNILLALDDFGSGYSGFSNLKNLPVDMLKTEREFIENIENDSYLQYFYYIMSETAHANGMMLIAEGIENQEQLQSVVKNGADLIQGYLFGKPMNTQTLEAQKDKFTQPQKELSGWTHRISNFKQWINGQDAYKITPALFRLQSTCISVLLDEPDLNTAVNKILEIVGSYFKVNRVYVFLRDEGTLFSNRYEWCADGVASQIHLFQHVDGATDGFYDVLRENEIVIANNAAQLPKNLQQRLRQAQQEGSVQSMVVMPMKQHGEILGFVGFDHMAERDWMPEELIILHNMCLICLIILMQDEHTDCGENNT